MSKATIVPGVHDLIPPEGRITVELLHPDTGRVRKRVKAENALMDWYRKNVVPNGGRGYPSNPQFGAGSTEYDTFCTMQDSLTYPWTEFVHKPNSWSNPAGVAGAATWLWGTDQNVAPNQALHHIPTADANGEVTGGVRLEGAFAPDGIQLKRGSVTLASCIRSWSRTRMVAEFGLAYGNGVWRSIGIGSLISQRTAPGGMRVCPPVSAWNTSQSNLSGNWNVPASSFSSGIDMNRGCVDFEDGGYWFRGNSTGLSRLLPTSTTQISDFVTLANLPGSGGQLSFAVNGSDFWVGRNQALYRCVKPTSNVAMTVTDTYNLAGTLGAQTILDIAVDRVGNRVFLLTSSHVHVINGTDGSPLSNFAHGMTIGALPAIEWSKAENQLHVSSAGTMTNTDALWGQTTNSPSNYIPIGNMVIKGFTSAGAAAKNFMIPQYAANTGGNQTHTGAPYMALNDAGLALTIRQASSVYVWPMAPTMASHALLPSDVVKTGADALRITYDFDFA